MGRLDSWVQLSGQRNNCLSLSNYYIYIYTYIYLHYMAIIGLKMFACGPLISVIISGETLVFLLKENHPAGNNSNMCLYSHTIDNHKFLLYP